MTVGHQGGSVEVVGALREAQLTIACAESLTGGLLCAALIGPPGASDVVRGGVVAYAADLKATLLGVDEAHLARYGAVDGGTAAQMARGVRDVCGSDIGVATTGEAGPDPSEGHPVGTVFIAVADQTGVEVRQLELSGARLAIRTGTVDAALTLVREQISAGGKD